MKVNAYIWKIPVLFDMDTYEVEGVNWFWDKVLDVYLFVKKFG